MAGLAVAELIFNGDGRAELADAELIVATEMVELADAELIFIGDKSIVLID
jgi:hypothetical protein